MLSGRRRKLRSEDGYFRGMISMMSGIESGHVGDRPIFNMAKSIWQSQYIDTSSLDRQGGRIDRPKRDVGVLLFLGGFPITYHLGEGKKDDE